jgi:TetR/AcrR family transcriptional repressor of mexJK operon
MAKTDLADIAQGAEDRGRSAQKRRAIIDAATNVFLERGYLGASMDEIAGLAAVSKQTVYKHFSTKEALFVAIVSSTTNKASDKVHNEMPGFGVGEDPAEYLRTYAYRQLTVVLQPRIMQLRRLVIGEVGRFPELAKALFDGGPKRAVSALGAALKDLADRGLLAIDDPSLAASQFNWLIMGEPLNRVMLLGDDAIPTPAELRRHAAASVRMFLAAYGMEGNRASRRRDRTS